MPSGLDSGWLHKRDSNVPGLWRECEQVFKQILHRQSLSPSPGFLWDCPESSSPHTLEGIPPLLTPQPVPPPLSNPHAVLKCISVSICSLQMESSGAGTFILPHLMSAHNVSYLGSQESKNRDAHQVNWPHTQGFSVEVQKQEPVYIPSRAAVCHHLSPGDCSGSVADSHPTSGASQVAAVVGELWPFSSQSTVQV